MIKAVFCTTNEGKKMVVEDDTVCEFFLLINKLKHMVNRNVRFADISAETNVHSAECRKGLVSLGMKSPGNVLWRLFEMLAEVGHLTFKEHGDYDSHLPIGVLVRLWETLPSVKMAEAA